MFDIGGTGIYSGFGFLRNSNGIPTGVANMTVDSRVRVVLLSGFLGAGKTTLLRQVLTWEGDLSDTVVLVNEFGDVGIDGMLLKDAGSDVVELASGCICCTLQADFKKSLQDTLDRFSPRRIFLEGSGVADPVAILSVINDTELRKRLKLEKVVTVLDADYWEAREAFGPLFYHQLEKADLILLNKIDTMDKQNIPRYLGQIHEAFPGRQVIPTVHCRLDPEAFWNEARPKEPAIAPIGYYRPAEAAGHGGPISDSQEANHPVAATHFVSFSFTTPQQMNEGCFEQVIKALPREIFRAKGPVRFIDRTVMFDMVGGKHGWRPWDGAQETRLAFIGWDVDGAAVLQQLETCVKR